MMHPPTALPRSLAEHVNPPPVDPIVRDEQRADSRAAPGGVGRLVALLRRRPRRGEVVDEHALDLRSRARSVPEE